MNKTLATLALAAVAALVLSACNGNGTGAHWCGSGAQRRRRVTVAPRWPYARHRQRPARSCTPAAPRSRHTPTISEISPSARTIRRRRRRDKVRSSTAAPTQGTIYYCLTGSGAGRKAFEGGSQDSGAPPTGPCAPLGATPTGFGWPSRSDGLRRQRRAMTSSEYQCLVRTKS